MARRGTPLPQSVRDEARRLRAGEFSYRAIARELGISDKTAKKYAAGSFRTFIDKESMTRVEYR